MESGGVVCGLSPGGARATMAARTSRRMPLSARRAADHQSSTSCSTQPERGVAIAIGALASATASPSRVHAIALVDWVELSRPMTRSARVVMVLPPADACRIARQVRGVSAGQCRVNHLVPGSSARGAETHRCCRQVDHGHGEQLIGIGPGHVARQRRTLSAPLSVSWRNSQPPPTVVKDYRASLARPSRRRALQWAPPADWIETAMRADRKTVCRRAVTGLSIGCACHRGGSPGAMSFKTRQAPACLPAARGHRLMQRRSWSGLSRPWCASGASRHGMHGERGRVVPALPQAFSRRVGGHEPASQRRIR